MSNRRQADRDVRRHFVVISVLVLVLVLATALVLLIDGDDADTGGGPEPQAPAGVVPEGVPDATPLNPDPAEGLGTEFEELVPPQRGIGCGPNGRLRQSCLAPIGGGLFLLRSAAAGWNAMNRESVRVYRVYLRPLGSLSAYRHYAGQVYLRNDACRKGRCHYAAVPGTSNHGWGLAVDLASTTMRRIVDRIGRKHGWSKGCSDASFEWWHVKSNYPCTGARVPSDPGPPGMSRRPRCKGKRVYVGGECRPILRKGIRGRASATKLLQRTLRNEGYCAVRVNGKYDLVTRSRTKRFQRAHGLRGDAVVGARTWRKIERFRGGKSRC